MNKLLSIEEEKKFLINFFHSEFCQYEVEKTDEFGDSVIGLDDNAYSCSCCDDILEGNIRLRGFRYYPKDGNIFCELTLLTNEYEDGIRHSYFGSMTFLTLNNERYSFEGKVVDQELIRKDLILESPTYGKCIFKASISFNIPEEIFEQVFTIGTKVRIKLFDSVDCKITPYGCSLLDLYRLAVRNIHLNDDRIDALYDIIVETSDKRRCAQIAKRKQKQEQERLLQERERVKEREKAELTLLLTAIQQLNWNDFSFIKTLIESPYSIPSVAALSDYCKRKDRTHPFLKEIAYCQVPYYLKYIKRRQRKRILNRSLLFLIIFYIFVGVLYPEDGGVAEVLDVIIVLSFYVLIGLVICSYFTEGSPKKGLPEKEIEKLKNTLTITDLDRY